MPIKESNVETYEKRAGFEMKGLGEKSKAILKILNENAGDFYTVKEIHDGLKTAGIEEKNVYINRTLWSLAKRKKGALVKPGTSEGKTVFAITEDGIEKLTE